MNSFKSFYLKFLFDKFYLIQDKFFQKIFFKKNSLNEFIKRIYNRPVF